MFKMLKEKRKKGFTLIELIVVIAVLGILVLLAAPRFLGYTADANVAAMQADAKVLSNTALIYNVENASDPETSDWPVSGEEFNDTIGEETIVGTYFTEADESSMSISTLKNDITEYVLVTDGDNTGEVYHVGGVEDRDGNRHHGVSLEVPGE